MATKTIPERKDVNKSDMWDLSSLFAHDDEWEAALKSQDGLTKKAAACKGTLGQSPENLLTALKALEEADKNLEAVYNYAGLQFSADESNAASLDKVGRAQMAYTKFSAETSFFSPELQVIPDEKIRAWIEKSDFDDYRIFIQKLLRLKEHILSEKEERILSLQSESAGTADKAFSSLTNTDMVFGSVNVNGEEQQLTQSTFSVFLDNPDRSIRENAYKKFYAAFESHQHTLASLYAGQVNDDVFEMRARGYSSCVEKALFRDKVPVSVYKNLIDTVHANLGTLHKYYELRRRVLGVDELRHYDVYVPLVKSVKMRTPYEDAVELCRAALAPLGSEYTDRLCNGLLHGWADRYENKGKRSGAFSSGVYKGDPYILLNYKEDVLRDVFTMAHEGGHSMHSWYSVHNNPYMQYNYTIFEAEVASTFNEELLFRHLLKNAQNDDVKAYLLATRAGDILATLHRQTMFAEFELKAHELVENGTPLSAELLRKIYRELLVLYFGEKMRFESNSDMEGLRIPHFYSAFYVYKYATGISASLALARRVTEGGKTEREDYFNFLKSGGSRYPIESLRMAGVDMESPAPVQAALDEFARMVGELETLLG
ncbi:MAG: oligoendopeptidase F [Treponema sp.]